ncbi:MULTISPECIES: methylglyoxal synthase [Leptospira]|uniref:Methylglyoxal synthase n=3 Tax=Leptospira TaxID=171 RepID=A0A2M9YNS6_9LEPT|nr:MULTISPECIES: methylglyoxal synthase [Leptospira]MBM9579683.1 methylglyoxal synthase [Leptospira ainlahdjerensis]PJZ53194.1 methylglyoxal synthase [Leptospira adleri]PJZ63997.1 methylglyoxal synthase [Leptospira adleri]RHX88601.1 methylglyoxal synthase [Leptospira stimsonii]RHX93017.1 methylglyoxal synthase [Leptospira stimsonii]
MKEVQVPATKRIALVAHDNRKNDLVEWAKTHREILSRHHLFGTGTTGKLINEEAELPVYRFLSGPLGGDQQIGAKIAEGDLDIVIFFWDPLTAQPHDPDVKALLRIAVLYNIPMACNRSTADYMISSPQFINSYKKVLIDYDTRIKKNP